MAAQSHTTLKVRNYQPEDLEQCRSLWAELTQWHRDIYADQSIGGSEPGKRFDEHLSQVGPENIWVAVSKGNIVGLAGLIREEGSAEVEPVVVKAGSRGLGIGEKLVQTIVGVAGKEKILKLTVRPVARNEEAVRFFHRMGFDTVGHVQLIMDLRNKYQWKAGFRMFDKDFKF